MKLREYGFIIWYLSKKRKAPDDEVGKLGHELAPLVDDWSEDNSTTEGNNADWFTESYQDWVGTTKQEER